MAKPEEAAPPSGWNESLHPRGKNGRFIDAEDRVSGTFTDANGQQVRLTNVQIVGMRSEGASKDDPFLIVKYKGPDGSTRYAVARASQINGTRAKARLDKPAGSTAAKPKPKAPAQPSYDDLDMSQARISRTLREDPVSGDVNVRGKPEWSLEEAQSNNVPVYQYPVLTMRERQLTYASLRANAAPGSFEIFEDGSARAYIRGRIWTFSGDDNFDADGRDNDLISQLTWADTSSRSTGRRSGGGGRSLRSQGGFSQSAQQQRVAQAQREAQASSPTPPRPIDKPNGPTTLAPSRPVAKPSGPVRPARPVDKPTGLNTTPDKQEPDDRDAFLERLRRRVKPNKPEDKQPEK